MAEPVPSSARSNLPQQTTFFEHLKKLTRRVETLERASRLRSASVGAGGITLYDGGALYFSQLDNPNDPTPGRIIADPNDELNYLRILPPYTTNKYTNSITLRGDQGPTSPGQIWIYSDGVIQLISQTADNQPSGRIHLEALEIFMGAFEDSSIWMQPNGDFQVVVDSGKFTLFGIPTTASAANLFLDATTAEIKRSTSSIRYKTDVQPAAIDPVDVLALEPKSFLDKTEVARAGEVVRTTPVTVGKKSDADGSEEQTFEPSRYVGFIAEDLDALPSMQQFVTYDELGRPDAIQYDRLSVALIQLAKAQQQQIDDLQTKIQAQETRLAKLEEAVFLTAKKGKLTP